MQKKIVSFVPFSDNNAYIDRMKDLIEEYAELKPITGLKKDLINKFVFRKNTLDIVWFNFQENQIINSRGELAIGATLLFLLKSFVITKVANKSVFVRHNHYPHKTDLRYSNVVKRVIDFYEKMFDVVLTHSGAEANPKKIYCPHPLYKVVESKADKIDFNLPENYFIVFGRIAPYKKIEELISNFPLDKNLVVAGAVGDQEYASRLSQIKHPGLIFLPKYLSEEESQVLVKGATAIIIAHADKDMIVSGSFFYAISLFKPIIAIRTDFFTWVSKELPSKIVTVANHLSDIKEIVNNYQKWEFDSKSKEIIQEKFGDKAISKVISHIFE